MKQIVYLACPYSHPDPMVRKHRFVVVSMVASKLVAEGQVIFSPISHSHSLWLAGGGLIAHDWPFWEKQDRAFLEVSKKLIVLMLDGWDRSVGVAAEMEIARQLGIPVEFMEGV